MDLLTSDGMFDVLLSESRLNLILGWLPSYRYVCLLSGPVGPRFIFTSVSAVLLQIKLAISSTTPYPARLQTDWDR